VTITVETMSGKTIILLLIFKLSFTMQTILTSNLNIKIINHLIRQYVLFSRQSLYYEVLICIA
jgi:hypothetical protein